MQNLDEWLNLNKLYALAEGFSHSYVRAQTESDYAERIRYRVDAPDWLIYVDGNTFRRLVRGFAFCSSGIAFCDDSGRVTKLSLAALAEVNVANTEKSLLINGQAVTLGSPSRAIAEKMVLLRRDLRAEGAVKRIPVRLARPREKMWYTGYEGEVAGPFRAEELQSRLSSGIYDPDALLVWNSGMPEWELVMQVPELAPSAPQQARPHSRLEPVCIDVNNCERDELLRLPGLSQAKITAFLAKRQNGIFLKSIYDLQREFDLKPHEAEMLKNMVVFRVENGLKSRARVIDL